MRVSSGLFLIGLLAACGDGGTGDGGTSTDAGFDGGAEDGGSPPLDGGEPGNPDAASVRSPKVLLVFIDGFIPEAIDTSDTPTIDALLVDAAFSRSARAESTTISGSGWSSFLTGVHWDKHGVPDNAFTAPNYADYPHIFARLKQARPEAVVGGCQSWEPIETGLVTPSVPDHSAFFDYYRYSDDYWDAESADSLCAEAVAGFAAVPNIDLLVVMFAELDGVAHESGYGAEYSSYQAMLSKIDGHIGDILAAIRARPDYAREDWLVVVGTDHAGNPALHHGSNIPEHRLTPLIVSGPSAAPGEIWPSPQTVDIVPTALRHLEVTIEESWGMDGVPVGLSPTAPPTAALGANLIFNGDAELERGYAGYIDAPDAWLPGWWDPGYLTVVRYGSEDGYPTTTGPGPPDRGASFFAGGWVSEDTSASWTSDVSNLDGAIDAGVRWTLSGWLGGYADQGDAASVTASFRDASDAELGLGTIGPVSAPDRGNVTGLLQRSATGAVPVGTRRIHVTLHAARAAGFNDGYADNLSLVLTAD